MNSISSLHSLYLFSPNIFLGVCFQYFSTSNSYHLFVSFLNIPFWLSFAAGDTLGFLPLLSQTDWVNYGYSALSPILNEHSGFPFSSLPASSRGPVLIWEAWQWPSPMQFLNICPHESDFKHCYGLIVLLQVRRLSCSTNCLLLDYGCFFEQFQEAEVSQASSIAAGRI